MGICHSDTIEPIKTPFPNGDHHPDCNPGTDNAWADGLPHLTVQEQTVFQDWMTKFPLENGDFEDRLRRALHDEEEQIVQLLIDQQPKWTELSAELAQVIRALSEYGDGLYEPD